MVELIGLVWRSVALCWLLAESVVTAYSGYSITGGHRVFSLHHAMPWIDCWPGPDSGHVEALRLTWIKTGRCTRHVLTALQGHDGQRAAGLKKVSYRIELELDGRSLKGVVPCHSLALN